MNDCINATIVLSLFAVSIISFLIGVYYFFIHNKCFKGSRRFFEDRIIVLSITLIIATWCMRYMVGIGGVLTPDGRSLSGFEEVINSLLHTLQSFDLNEDYTAYLVGGKELMRLVFPEFAAMGWFYSIYVSILNVICPIAGGALLFAILTSIFPKIKLWFLTLPVWCPVCYFSELNDASLSLAKSIRNSDGHLIKTIIIFFDVYTDSKDEVVSERIQKAKNINAVCLKEDISDISIRHRKGKKFFLIDQKEIKNLQALAAFRSKKKYKRLKQQDEIYVFGDGDSDRLVLDSVRKFLIEKCGKDNVPHIMSVNGVRNLIYSLLENKPLFSAKINKARSDHEKLHIAILGSGQIGTEMFLATYWCGQLLDYKLQITVISKEKACEFKARINHINSEILETGTAGSELLRVYEDETTPSAPVYFDFQYVEMDIRQDDLYSKMRLEGARGGLADADYFLVALGSDEDNLETADKIAQYISLSKNCVPGNKVPVAYVVYDDALHDLLKDSCDNANPANPFVDMYPFGSLCEIYNYNAITLKGIRDHAERIGDAYQSAISRVMTDEKSIEKYHADSYAYWANVARAIHIRYKAFCVNKTVDEYINDVNDESSELRGDEKLAWLEHRRWNAFMRVKGFKKPTLEQERGYIMSLPDAEDNTNKGKHKNLELKLHPCIVESALDSERNGRSDLLDKAAERLKSDYRAKNLGIDDFKKYDRPENDVV